MAIQMLTNRSTQNYFTPTFAGAPQTNSQTANVDTFTENPPLPSRERVGVRGTNHPLMASMFPLGEITVDDMKNFMPWFVGGVLVVLGGIFGYGYRKEIAALFRGPNEETGARETGAAPPKEDVGSVNLEPVVCGRSVSGQLDDIEPNPEIRSPEGTLIGYSLERELPRGAINPVALIDPNAFKTRMDSSANPIQAGLEISILPVQELKVFPTLAEMQTAIGARFGEAFSDPSQEGITTWKVGNGAFVQRYENAFGETVVIVEAENFFDKQGTLAGTAQQFKDHLNDVQKLPPGEYSLSTVRYHFGPDGKFKGVSVNQSTIKYQEKWTVREYPNGLNYVVSSNLGRFGEPGQPIPAFSRERFVAAVKADHPKIGVDEIRKAVVASLKDWFALDVQVRAGIINSRRSWGQEPITDLNKMSPVWVVSRAMDHIEGRGKELFSVLRINDVLQVTNATVIRDEGIPAYRLSDIFSFGNDPQGFPPRALVSSVAIALRKRFGLGLGEVTLKDLKAAVEKVLLSARHDNAVVGPNYRKWKGATIPVVVGGRPMELLTSGIEDSVRRELFKPKRTEAQTAADTAKTPLKLGATEATEFIPREWLPAVLLTPEGNLKPIGTLTELENLMKRHYGEPHSVEADLVVSGKPWLGLKGITRWGLGHIFELKDGVSAAEATGSLNHHVSGIDFSTGDISHIAMFNGSIYDGRGRSTGFEDGEPGSYPYTSRDVYYFFDGKGNVVSTMIVNTDANHAEKSRVVLRADTDAVKARTSTAKIEEERAAAEEARKRTNPSPLERAGAEPKIYITQLEMKAHDLAMKQKFAEARVHHEEIVAITDAMLEKLGEAQPHRLDYKAMEWYEVARYSALAGLQMALTAEGKEDAAMLVERRIAELKPWVERLPLYIKTATEPFAKMMQGMAAEGLQFARDVVEAPRSFTPADAARNMRGIISLAFRDIQAGRFHLAGDKFESLGKLIKEMTEHPGPKALSSLGVAINEARADMAHLLGQFELARSYFSQALAAALAKDGIGNETGLIERGIETGMLKDLNGERMVTQETFDLLKAYWKEVPPEEGLFRDPLDALRGGKAKQGMSDVIPPPDCAHLDAADLARVTREAAKTRREILKAHREAQKATERAEKR